MRKCTYRHLAREDSGQHVQSDPNLHWMYFWIAKDAKFLHKDGEDSNQSVNGQVDLSPHWMHMSDGTVSQVVSQNVKMSESY